LSLPFLFLCLLFLLKEMKSYRFIYVIFVYIKFRFMLTLHFSAIIKKNLLESDTF
jgi:hypothetical protein